MYKIVEWDRPGQTVRVIVREADGANIPFDEQNADYQVYLAWVAEGNTAPIEQL